jgi:hypothetical protein
MNYDELEAKVLDSIDASPKFAQKLSPDFEQEIVPDRSLIGLGIGGGIAGIVTSQVSNISMLPSQLSGVTGLIPAVVGTVVNMIIKPKGMIKDLSNGLIVGGIAEFVSSFASGRGYGVAQKREKLVENTQIVPHGLNAIW